MAVSESRMGGRQLWWRWLGWRRRRWQVSFGKYIKTVAVAWITKIFFMFLLAASICSFIACISATIGGGVISMRDGMLTFYRSDLLGRYYLLVPLGLVARHWYLLSLLLEYHVLPSSVVVLPKPSFAW